MLYRTRNFSSNGQKTTEKIDKHRNSEAHKESSEVVAKRKETSNDPGHSEDESVV